MSVLWDRARGPFLPLPASVERFTGPIRLHRSSRSPRVVANFAQSIDGVVAFDRKGTGGGSEITGRDPYDRVTMAVLRASADLVLVGAGTVRASPRHVWTAGHLYRPLADEFEALRKRLGKRDPAPVVVVSASGRLDLTAPIFSGEEVEVTVLTSRQGLRRLDLPRGSRVRATAAVRAGPFTANHVLAALHRKGVRGLVLLEGGPQLLGQFLYDRRLDELMLTVAPQVAGRVSRADRPGLVRDRKFGPTDPRWARLIGVRRGGETLFLRYVFSRPEGRALPRGERSDPT